MAKELGVGIIGCGNISTTYLSLAPLFKGLKMLACADINPNAAQLRAEEYGVKAQTVDELLANDELDVIVNLTIPATHFSVSKAILEAGKHVYSEKPLVLSLQEGEELRALAKAKNLAIGCAPDTFLGGSHQLARKTINDGTVGRITSGTCHVMSPGMEMWHPNPGFFFLAGGGPILDLGPYYIANLINLIGPVKRVGALTSMANPTRNHHQPTAGGHGNSRRDANQYSRASGIPERGDHHAFRQLGCLVAPAREYGTLWHGRLPLCAGPELLRWHRGGVRAQHRYPAAGDVGPSLRQG